MQNHNTEQLLREPLLPLAQAARKVPPKGVHVNTLRRWISPGRDVSLEFATIGAKLYTSEPAILRFIVASTNESRPTSEMAQPHHREHQRRNAKELLDKELGTHVDSPKQCQR